MKQIANTKMEGNVTQQDRSADRTSEAGKWFERLRGAGTIINALAHVVKLAAWFVDVMQ